MPVNENRKRKLAKEYQEKYKKENQAKLLQYKKDYRAQYKDEICKKKAKYTEDNREAISEKKLLYNCEHRPEIKSKQSVYNSEHRPEINNKQSVYNSKHRPEIKNKQSVYNSKHRPEIKNKQSVYDSKHRTEIKNKQSVYDSKHRTEIKNKQSVYDSKHRTEIKNKQSVYDSEHRAEIKNKQSVYDSKHRAKISATHSNYNKEHRTAISNKQNKYNELHRKEINTKQVKYNKARAERIRRDKSLTSSVKRSARHKAGSTDKSKSRECEADSSRQTSTYTTSQQNKVNMNKLTRRHRAQLKQQITTKMHERRFMKNMFNNKQNRNKIRVINRSIYTKTVQILRIRRLIKSAMLFRSKAYGEYKYRASVFQQKVSAFPTHSAAHLTKDTLEECIGGTRCHTSHSEPFYLDTAYNVLPPDITLVVDDRGITTNTHTVQPLSKNAKGKRWTCGATCNIRQKSINNFIGFIQTTTISKEKELYSLFQNIDICHNKARHPTLQGHSITCIDNSDCPSTLRTLRELSVHYSSIRDIVRDIYPIKKYVSAITLLDKALESGNEGNLDYAMNIIKNLLQKPSVCNLQATACDSEVTSPELDEEKIIATYKGIVKCYTDDNNFHDTPCACCERLFQKTALTLISKSSLKPTFENNAWCMQRAYWIVKHEAFNNTDTDLYDTIYICHYCKDSLNKSNMPARSALNGLNVDPIPPSLKELNIFESMLLQKSKCFQTILRLGPVKHRLPHSELLKSLKGRVVYLPLPIESNKAMIPKGLAANHELHILVNGVPTKNKIIWQDIVRVEKLKTAMDTLTAINPLYTDLTQTSTKDINEYIFNTPDDTQTVPTLNPGPEASLERITPADEINIYQQFTIHPISHDIPTKQMDTYKIKECTGQPLSVFDKSLDLLCFPTLFPCGQFGKHHPRLIKLSESEYRASRLLNFDGRFRRNQQYLFHLLYDSDIKNLSSSISHMLRQSKSGVTTVDEMLSKIESGDNQLEANLHTLFSNIRGTRQYWYSRQGEVNSMIREYGPPTWFLTLSCAEYTWDNLHDHLRHINSDLPNVDKMTPGELCTCDPVSVCRHYHAKFHSILRNLILSKDNPVLGPVENYFWRVEYQMRGAPHIHLLLWIKSAPIIGKDSNEDILKFILQYVTCRIPSEHSSPTLNKYVNTFQKHKCNPYCQRKSKTNGGKYYTHCRFGFPRRETKTAKLNDAFSSMRHRQHGRSSKRLYELSRTAAESYINDYNPALLLALGANTDVQYIGEATWSLAKYVTSYITKAEKVELQELWQELTHKSLSSRLWTLGLKALTHRQCGAYEASDRLLGTHLYGKSASIRFINTLEPHQRNRVLKPFKQLQEIKESNPDSAAIYMNSYIDNYYPKRPDTLETTSLYSFMQTYDRMPSTEKIPEGWLVLKDELGLLRKRGKPYVINHIQHKLNKSTEENEKYYHCLLMLFMPWREENELKNDCSSYETMFTQKIIELPDMLSYHQKTNNIIAEEERAENILNTDTQPSQHQEEDPSNAMKGHETIAAEHAMAEVTTTVKRIVTLEEINNNIQLLNTDQSRIFNKIKSHLDCEENEDSLRLFVSGVGGTGKSYLIQMIEQWMLGGRSNKSDSLTVAIAAPTGLAAHNVGGVTIHRLLMLPVEHGSTAKYTKLSSDSLSVVRSALHDLELLIIDEISMVSSLLLTYIHLRLCEITGKSLFFGGINIVILGDLLQLPPVKGNPPFTALKREEIQTNLESVGACHLWETFQYDELIINVRQSSDESYANLLSRVRVGEVTSADSQVLQTRLVAAGENIFDQVKNLYNQLSADGTNPVCLLSKVDACQKMNEKMLYMLDVPIVKIPSIDEIDNVPSKKVKQIAEKKLEQLTNDVSRTAGLESTLHLSIGARVMLRRNIDMEAGMVNGSMGTLRDFIYDGKGQVKEIEVLFDNGHQTNISRFGVPFELMKGIYVHRKQFPISLSYAITIHKCQGLSLKCAIVDIGRSVFGSGMTYVALSRVTSLSGLHLIDFCTSRIVADTKSVHEYNRLRKVYRSDLPSLPIINKRREPYIVKIPDIQEEDMIPARGVQEKQNTSLLHPNPLFVNRDGVSCYGNSIAQLFLHVEQFRNIILEADCQSVTNIPVTYELQQLLLTSMNNQCSLLNVFPLRRAVDETFAQTEQNDAYEFLLHLLNKLSTENNTIPDLVMGVEGSEERCTNINCHNRLVTGHTPFLVLNLHFPSSENTPISFKQLLEQWLPFDRTCPLCAFPMERRTIVRATSRYLVLSLCIFHNENQKIIRPITGFTANNITVGGARFRAIATVCHSGATNKSGHYWCLLKKNNTWLYVSDETMRVQKRFVINLKDVYLILLEKILVEE